MTDELNDLEAFLGTVTKPEKKDSVTIGMDIGEDVSPLDMLAATGLKQETQGTAIEKRWMQHHRFVLVQKADEIRALVDRAIAHGRCSLDLETQGLDNRIEYDENGNPYTRHKIVGYCIGVRGVGYYIPIRHKFDPIMGESDPNAPIEVANTEITRLCCAAQPELTDEGKAEDPYGSMKVKNPPKLVIYFWNAKFDQEMLYPVTGIDFWHPLSFEDGLLAAYLIYSDDKELNLKDKAEQRLSITDDKGTHRYEMIHFKELFPKGMPESEMKIADLLPEEGSNVLKYCCSDAICTEALCEATFKDWEFTGKKLKFSYDNVLGPALELNKVTYQIEKQTVQAVRVMERARVKVDRAEVRALFEEASRESAKYEEKIKALAETKGFKNFNPGSAAQLSEFLFGEAGLDIRPKPAILEASGQYQTDAATLERMSEENPNVEVLDWVVKLRQVDKIIGTYLEGLLNNCDEQDQLRFQFKQHGAATGRFTAPGGKVHQGFSGIPIHGIPARDDPKKPKVAHSMRRMFVARPGYVFAKVDYSGQELRIATNVSKEPLWLKEYQKELESGEEADLHTLTAQAFYPGLKREDSDFKLKRTAGKTANFALIYGGGTQAVQRATKCDKNEAARRKANFDKSVPVFAKWVKQQQMMVKSQKGVRNAFGRWIPIPDAAAKAGDTINGKVIDEQEARKIQAACARKSTNFPIQSAGADVMKISLVKLLKEFGRRGWLRNGGDDSVRMLMTVHDEIVFEIRNERLMEAMPVIIEIMESPARMVRWNVPLIVEALVGKTWAAKHNWAKLLKGTEEVPEWLADYITSGKKAPPSNGSPPSNGGGPKLGTGAAPAPVGPKNDRFVEVVTFRIPKKYVTLASVRLIRKALAGAELLADRRGKGPRLRLINEEDEVLIEAADNFEIDPEEFSRELKAMNLGPGRFTLSEEDLSMAHN